MTALGARLIDSLREWLAVRRRVREECAFHLDRAAAELQDLGWTGADARAEARARFGGRRYRRSALHELGGDGKGLLQSLRDHRVPASAWTHPCALALAVALLAAASPRPREILASASAPARHTDWNREVVFYSAHGAYPWGITTGEFEALKSLKTVTGLRPYRGQYARARAVDGATIASVQAEAQARTGHRRFWALPLLEPQSLPMQPMELLWLLLALYSAYRGCSRGLHGARGWLYGLALTALHAAASLLAWGVMNQVLGSWAGHAGPFALLLLAFGGLAAVQCRYASKGLTARCPVCLDRLVLPLTQGTAGRVLLDCATTESVCAHGHGALTENRWNAGFRPAAPHQLFDVEVF